MYQAFEPALLLDKLPVKVESLAHHRQNLYVGTSSGVLLVYRITQVSEGSLYVDEFGEGYGIELVRSVKQFSKRSIEKIEIIPELGLLIALTDNQVNAYDLNSLQFQVSLAPSQLTSKGPLQTAIITGIAQLAPLLSSGNKPGPPPQATPTLTTRIGIAAKRTLVILTWVDGEFASDRTQEFTIPDRVRCLEFLTADQLWLGSTSKEYFILQLDSGTLVEAAPSTNVPSTDQKTEPPNNKGGSSGVTSFLDLAYSSTQYVSNYNPLSLRSAVPRPIMLKVSAQEMIIVKGEVGLFVGIDGSTTRRSAIHFPLEPIFLGYSFPYLIIGSSKSIDVRNLDSQVTIQNYELAPVAITRGKAPFIATANQIWRWVPSHFADQINKLIELKLFEEALTLLEQNRDRVSEVQLCTAEQIRELYALDLFLQGQFDRALGMALELQLPPNQIIGLYPPVISGEQSSEEEQGSETEQGNAPYQYIKDPRQWSQPRLIDAVQALVQYLTQLRTNLLAQIQSLKSEDSLATSHQSADDIGSLESKIIDVTLIDTTLVRCYLLTNHAMIGPLLRINNYVNVPTVDQLLASNHKYRELIDLYYSKGLHRKALQLLKTLGVSDDNTSYGLGGVSPTIQYLERLGGDHFDLIQEFVPWCISGDPEAMLLFTEDHATAESLPVRGVLDLLESIDIKLAKDYLHSLLPSHYIERDPPVPHPCESQVTPELHTRLALIYLEELHQEISSIKNGEVCELALELERIAYQVKSPSDDSIEIDQELLTKGSSFLRTLKRMNQFLVAEPALYKPETLLGRLPTEMFFKPRALVLSQLHQHDQALRILVYRLNDINGAEDYCRRINSRQAFQTLLRVYLKAEEAGSSTSYLDCALRLLDCHGARVEAGSTLELLPTTVPMHSLGNFLKRNLCELMSSLHSAHINLSLLRAERSRLNQRLVQLKSEPILLESSTLCPVCLKRIGTSAFAIFPDRRVVHYSCQSQVST